MTAKPPSGGFSLQAKAVALVRGEYVQKFALTARFWRQGRSMDSQ
jgi:hypothetical protein